MNRITAVQSSISDLFTNSRYSIDYYQRTYRWEPKHVQDLIDDLEQQFEREYDDGAGSDATKYSEYFLGSIIVARQGRANFIVDGQQRMTTLLLLLIAVRHRLPPGRLRNQVTRLIAGADERRPRFPLDNEERQVCLRGLFRNGEYAADLKDRIGRALSERYELIARDIGQDISDQQIGAFASWLINRVVLVKITTITETDAYTIFETMNDRGLSLTPAEMLRGHLLSHITSTAMRRKAATAWAQTISGLADLDEEVGRESIKPEDAIQAWLRAQHANTMSGHGRDIRDADRGDFERIGSEFHRWVRDNSARLGLTDEIAVARFITQDFQFYANWYIRLRRAAATLTADATGLEDVRHVGVHQFNLQYMVLLSALRVGEPEEISLRKIRIISAYLDIRLHHRLWQGDGIAQTQMRGEMFRVAQELRGKTPRAIAKLLSRDLETLDDFEEMPDLSLSKGNKRVIRVLLARLTCFVEEKTKDSPLFDEYLVTGINGFEIDHIIPDRYDRFRKHWGDKRDFDLERGFIGGLLLLPTPLNRELGSKLFRSRRPKYRHENLLAASLDHEAHYPRSPIRSVNSRHSLRFKPYDQFGSAELRERQRLLKQVAGKIWSPERIHEAAKS